MLAADIQQLLIDAPGAGSEDAGHRGQRRRRLGQVASTRFLFSLEPHLGLMRFIDLTCID